MTEELAREYRGDLLEVIHNGHICVVDADGVKHILGDPQMLTYFRSSSKPVQALPLLMRDAEQAYGFTPRETAILSGSIQGEEMHIEVIESILKKTELDESIFIMKPTYPLDTMSARKLIGQGKPPRKIYHNCIGKHIAMALLARELGEREQDYWRTDGRVHQEIMTTIARLSGAKEDEIRCGTDGCGVAVFALPLHYLAGTFLRMARPEMISEPTLRRAAEKNWEAIHAHPEMIGGSDHHTRILCKDPNIIAKDGALGVYCLGLREEGLGIVIRIQDGTASVLPQLVAMVLEKINYKNISTIEELRVRYPMHVINDNETVIGRIEASFSF